VLRYLAAAYLIWFGFSLIRGGAKAGKPADVHRARGLGASFAAGIALTLGDVKAILFYAALFPVFVDVTVLSTFDIGVHDHANRRGRREVGLCRRGARGRQRFAGASFQKARSYGHRHLDDRHGRISDRQRVAIGVDALRSAVAPQVWKGHSARSGDQSDA
jgi:hypothetical protein